MTALEFQGSLKFLQSNFSRTKFGLCEIVDSSNVMYSIHYLSLCRCGLATMTTVVGPRRK